MIDVVQAIDLICQASRPLPAETVPLSDSIGRVLSSPVLADLDSPPFDKSMVDGYAIRQADFEAGRREFRLAQTITAGDASEIVWAEGTAVSIMTGAQVPRGFDAVVMLEQTTGGTSPEKEAIRVDAPSISLGQNILRRGTIYRAGDCLVDAGNRCSANSIGLLAEAGVVQVPVSRRPRVAIVATGNELCPPNRVPAASQIRNSNGPLLMALARAFSAEPRDLGIVGDDERKLSETIQQGLEADVLILTGGVSVGMLDLVPRALKALQVEEIFHKVSLKPGKPVWFGAKTNAQSRCLVFGLPGNPVSTFVCFHLFVRTALACLTSDAEGRATMPSPATLDLSRGQGNRWRGYLAFPHAIRGDRPTYWPSRFRIEDGRAMVEPLAWKGSADQRCLRVANCLAYFPVGDREYSANELVDVILV